MREKPTNDINIMSRNLQHNQLELMRIEMCFQKFGITSSISDLRADWQAYQDDLAAQVNFSQNPSSPIVSFILSPSKEIQIS